jgi:SAM-dependent MidA family methyltransferase
LTGHRQPAEAGSAVSTRDSRMHTRVELPQPASDAAALSDSLRGLIAGEIEAAGGAIPFSRYMELCLYAPGLGYYSAGQRKFGAGGDFITAPEVSSLFGRCMARCCAEILQQTGGEVLEFGAGSGRLAVDLLGELDVLGCLPRQYFILERSADLQQRQQQLLCRELPQLAERVVWLDSLPAAGFRGVMLANEVLDAMAVERFHWQGSAAAQYFVTQGAAGFEWLQRPVESPGLQAAIDNLVRACNLPAGYVSEINLSLDPWLRSIAGRLGEGLLLLVDYGYERDEYYHLQRSSGTLMCHYRQRAHADPFLWPGLQDITAHVDFTAVAEAATAAGLEVGGYTNQAWFLLDCGLESLLQAAGPTDTAAYLQLAQQAKTLILPGEMGERFKCIALTRGSERQLPGFRMQDFRHRL